MPIASPRYALWENDELIYYGHARGDSMTIQSCLREHLARAMPCTERATHYGWEISANPRAREADLLREFERANRKLPRCNAP
jgi:hypothetical protein